MGLADPGWVVLEPEQMVPAAGQGVIGVTVRADDIELRELLAGITDPDAEVTGTAERALLGVLDGSCRTPIGAYACLAEAGCVHLTGLVARPDGSFLLRRELMGMAADARRIGIELGTALRADSPADLFE
jgi:hydroxymethylbilane synthase